MVVILSLGIYFTNLVWKITLILLQNYIFVPSIYRGLITTVIHIQQRLSYKKSFQTPKCICCKSVSYLNSKTQCSSDLLIICNFLLIIISSKYAVDSKCLGKCIYCLEPEVAFTNKNCFSVTTSLPNGFVLHTLKLVGKKSHPVQ